MFLELYEQKLDVSDLELIRQKRKPGQEAEEKEHRPQLWRVLPVLLLAAAVSAGSIWGYRKLEALDAKRHLEMVREMTQQGKNAGDMEAAGMQEENRTCAICRSCKRQLSAGR